MLHSLALSAHFSFTTPGIHSQAAGFAGKITCTQFSCENIRTSEIEGLHCCSTTL